MTNTVLIPRPSHPSATAEKIEAIISTIATAGVVGYKDY